jgi:hypothetical protein
MANRELDPILIKLELPEPKPVYYTKLTIYDWIWDHYMGAKNKLEKLTELVDRTRCFCCYRKINRDETNEMIILEQKQLDLWKPSFDKMIDLKRKHDKEQSAIRSEKDYRFKKQVKIFQEKHITDIKRVIREFNKTKEPKLPDLNPNEQKLWNRAFYNYCVGSVSREEKYIERDEFYYEL